QRVLRSFPTRRSSDLPPVSWSKEAKESWNTLPPAIQNAVLKREKEFSDGIKQYADDAKKIRELEPYFAPHRQSMAANGVNEVQRSEEHTSELQSRENL